MIKVEAILEEYGIDDFTDVDLVFEAKDGTVTNIQFNEEGAKYEKTFASASDFLATLDDRLTNYKDFYNSVGSDVEGFSFIGYADGHSIDLF